MSFNNPILAGETLVRIAMKSENFQTGLSGWRVARNGDAEFNDVFVRGSTSGESGAFDVVFANEELYYKGTELTEYAEQFARGIMVYGQLPVQQYDAEDESKILEVRFDAVNGRGYRVEMDPWRVTSIDTVPINARVHFKYTTDGTDPATNGVVMFVEEMTIRETFRYQSISGWKLFYPGVTGEVRVLLTLGPVGSGTIRGNFDSPSLTVYDVGKSVASTVIDRYVPPGGGSEGGATKTHYEFNHAITVSDSYRGDGSQFNHNSSMYQGYSPFAPENGNMRSFGELNIADLDALIGVPKADYEYLEWYFYYDHWHYNAGGTAVIGSYDRNGFQRPDLIRMNFGRDQGRWVDVLNNATIFDAIFNGYMLGVMLGPGEGTDPQFYGYARGATQGLAVGMQASYYK